MLEFIVVLFLGSLMLFSGVFFIVFTNDGEGKHK